MIRFKPHKKEQRRSKQHSSRLHFLQLYFFLFFLSNTPSILKAQFYNLPNDYSFSILSEKLLAKKDSSIHSSIKPYVTFFSEKYKYQGDTQRLFKYLVDDPFIDAVFHKHLINVAPKKQNFDLHLDPLLNLEFGRDLADTLQKNLYTNTRGFIASGHIGEHFYFETLLTENQSMFPDYISQYADSTKIIPGQGRWKNYKTTGYDYAFSSGFISIQATKNFNIQIGHGKHKIGHGYRSLILSDNSVNYPYAKFTQQWFKGKLQYTNIYAVFMNLVPALTNPTPGTEVLFQKKASAFQYLSYNVNTSIQLGFFQGLIWQPADEKNQQHLNWHYFNPLIYTNLIAYQLDNSNNILIGNDFKIKVSKSFNLYGQFMLDNMGSSDDGDGWGSQLGVNYFDAFGIKNFFIQGEFNKVGKNSYSDYGTGSSGSSYSHYNQNIAYTPGNGSELVIIGNYRYHRFYLDLKFNYQMVDRPNEYRYTNSIVNTKLGYVINPSYNFNIYLGLNSRAQYFDNFNALNNKTNYIYLGLRTSIYNLYYDF